MKATGTVFNEDLTNIGPKNSGSKFFIEFLNKLEGWKTKCKNLHWAAPKKNIHVYLMIMELKLKQK